MNKPKKLKPVRIDKPLDVVSFSNRSSRDKKLLGEFVRFPHTLYKDDPRYVPQLDYEYLGFRLLGVTGFFEPRRHFFKHAEMKFFLAYQDGEVVGRCNAFINYHHNRYWKDTVGFFGQFDAVHDQGVAALLLKHASGWLESKGMTHIRGPQNLPVNEATPGLMTSGFESRPVIYYTYNKPYYEELLLENGFSPLKRVHSWEIPIHKDMEKKLARVGRKVVERYDITMEAWGERPTRERKLEMLAIYNDAWSDNFGFIPFTAEEFDAIIDDMMMVADKKLFRFLYVEGEPAAFIGAVPNIVENMAPVSMFPRWELLRTARMLLLKRFVKGVRLGYLGVRKKFRSLGLDGVMIWKLKTDTYNYRYQYCDIGWVLEDNQKTIRLVELMEGRPSKTYTIFQKPL